MRSLEEILSDDIKSISLEELRLLIDKADSAYYRPELEAIITDAKYDLAKKRLKSEAPQDERNTRVGVLYSTEELRNKVVHSIPMGSLDNTEDGRLGYDKWYNNCCEKLSADVGVMASLKIDGSSIRARYEKGKLKVIATRGNGEVGENITANGINFQNLPLELPKPITCDVRGEAILYIQDFKKIMEREFLKPFDEIQTSDVSNPRNVGNGILGRDNGKDSNLIRFLAFNLVIDGQEFQSETEKFEILSDLGFTVVPHVFCENPTDLYKFYCDVLEKRDQLPFEIDGIVVSLNNHEHQSRFVTDDIKTKLRPKYARAIKFPHKSGITKIIGVDVTVGHTGAIIPTAILEEVRIGGVNVKHVLLNNWEEISRLRIDIGDEVEVVLAGDIIPKVVRCVTKKSSRPFLPEPLNCPSCSSKTTRELRDKQGAVTYCSEPTKCSEAVFGKISRWVGGSKTGVGILGIGDTMLRTFWNLGMVKDPSDLYLLTVESIKDIELEGGVRIGESRAKMIIDNINKTRNLPIHTFLGSLGIELLGRRRVQILQQEASGQLDTLDQWLDTESFKKIKLKGLGDAIKSAIISGIEANKSLILRLVERGVGVGVDLRKSDSQEPESKNQICVSKPFLGLSFCFTGTRDCLEDVERLGGEIKSGVSKNLNYLVQKDATSSSNKTIKAEQYGVRIISVDFLKKVIDGKASFDNMSVVDSNFSVNDDSVDADSLVDSLDF